ncbi:hypothetical protein AWB75_05147 [Caballeronia catudaia]|uniref:Uncharacterized protein n=1 Tax=Caballeronia catudaia TaxID=1777136 RepID=A0A158CHG2_9BURK|nr:hypothetical protein [Caballeronia catudaia]SAK81720.1 hypothetical protein AWB75_05147 [Caballeronia catudaia]
MQATIRRARPSAEIADEATDFADAVADLARSDKLEGFYLDKDGRASNRFASLLSIVTTSGSPLYAIEF